MSDIPRKALAAIAVKLGEYCGGPVVRAPSGSVVLAPKAFVPELEEQFVDLVAPDSYDKTFTYDYPRKPSPLIQRLEKQDRAIEAHKRKRAECEPLGPEWPERLRGLGVPVRTAEFFPESDKVIVYQPDFHVPSYQAIIAPRIQQLLGDGTVDCVGLECSPDLVNEHTLEQLALLSERPDFFDNHNSEVLNRTLSFLDNQFVSSLIDPNTMEKLSKAARVVADLYGMLDNSKTPYWALRLKSEPGIPYLEALRLFDPNIIFGVDDPSLRKKGEYPRTAVNVNKALEKLDSILRIVNGNVLLGSQDLPHLREELSNQSHDLWDFLGINSKAELRKLEKETIFERSEAILNNLTESMDQNGHQVGLLVEGDGHTQDTIELCRAGRQSYVILFPDYLKFEDSAIIIDMPA